MTKIKPDEVDQLVDTLNNLPLEEPQRALLDAILWVAADIREQTEEDEERAYTSEFTHAFKKEQADLVLEYVAALPGATTPPSIQKNPTPPPGPDDDD